MTTPNPGSDTAIEQGCTCPVLDNGHGNGYLGQSGVFWISEDCQIHARNANNDAGGVNNDRD